MVIGYILTFAGLAVGVTGLVLQRTMRGKLDTMIHVGGMTVPEVQSMRRALIAGVLPEDPSRRDIALAYARQAIHNIPLQLRRVVLIFGGVLVVIVGQCLLPSRTSSTVVVYAVFGFVIGGALFYLVATSLRALGAMRRVIAAHPIDDAPR